MAVTRMVPAAWDHPREEDTLVGGVVAFKDHSPVVAVAIGHKKCQAAILGTIHKSHTPFELGGVTIASR
jgi:hypothetical protein